MHEDLEAHHEVGEAKYLERAIERKNEDKILQKLQNCRGRYLMATPAEITAKFITTKLSLVIGTGIFIGKEDSPIDCLTVYDTGGRDRIEPGARVRNNAQAVNTNQGAQ